MKILALGVVFGLFAALFIGNVRPHDGGYQISTGELK